MEKKAGVGLLHCKICGQNFQTPINSLSQPVDIYSDWVDACEAVAEDAEAQTKLDEEFVEKDVPDADEDDDY
ncbi:unnamed protein product [Kuraishia capsulata CBS 1993]|uniref:Transcription elongation factor 1 homolog n=1 Tax=Kuraishia capsulata CBS 1993 TaxID=1382522 RepID=W6MP73_9ASCO|nr:uncharacterized protein KUCA_T00004418001 [Kuraishia capsulata CBS 1993]CDK28436.1 unnamed protein product [Kuraishia capsulata CBS 1993]